MIRSLSCGRQLLIHRSEVAPRCTVLNPLITVGLPPDLRASAGIDTFSHAVEALHSTMREPVTDSIAVESIRLISQNLETALTSDSDPETRTNMHTAASTAGITASNAFFGIVHALAHALDSI